MQGIDNSRLSLFLHANILGLIRPNDGQGDVADGPQRGGAAVLGGQAAQEDTEVRIQGHWAGITFHSRDTMFDHLGKFFILYLSTLLLP